MESVRSYGTRFLVGEQPISEGGIWLNGRKDGIDWADVVTQTGLAHGGSTRMISAERRIEQRNLGEGTSQEGDYDDPTAVLGGVWGQNQHAKGIVFSKNPTEAYFQEVQFRLRTTIRPNICTGYEVFWRCLRSETAYAEIVRWNGKVGDFTSLSRSVGPDFGVGNGDLVEATVFGNVLTGFINGIAVISATDDAFDSGCPGIGFNFGVGDTSADHGFTHFEVASYED